MVIEMFVRGWAEGLEMKKRKFCSFMSVCVYIYIICSLKMLHSDFQFYVFLVTHRLFTYNRKIEKFICADYL